MHPNLDSTKTNAQMGNSVLHKLSIRWPENNIHDRKSLLTVVVVYGVVVYKTSSQSRTELLDLPIIGSISMFCTWHEMTVLHSEAS